MIWASRAVAALFFGAALFHVAALGIPTVSDPSPPWRHAAFIAINGVFGTAFWRRPRWLFLAYLVLAVQQAHGHGTALLAALDEGRVDWQSVAALGSIPFFGGVAWTATRERSRASSRALG